MKNNFNLIAPIYDRLSFMVFGRTLRDAQIKNLNDVQPACKVLIVGGGTGEVLEWLPNADLHVTFVELSKGMLEKAKIRNGRLDRNKVEFVNTDVMKIQGTFDLIITNFFLDCFSPEKLQIVLAHLKTLLDSSGQIFVTDFVNSDKLKHRMLLKLMHSFFRIFSSLESKELADIPSAIEQAGFRKIRFQKLEQGFLFNAAYTH